MPLGPVRSHAWGIRPDMKASKIACSASDCPIREVTVLGCGKSPKRSLSGNGSLSALIASCTRARASRHGLDFRLLGCRFAQTGDIGAETHQRAAIEIEVQHDFPLGGIDMPVVDQHLKIEVIAGGKTGTADVGDDL